jgi:protein associated with RNAse G/E
VQEDNALQRFAKGSTVVRRDVLRGRVWTATPYRVVEDSGDALLLACSPCIEILAPTTWIEWLRTGDDNVRKQGIPNLASGRWDLGHWVWRETTVLMRLSPDDCFSVLRFFPADGVPSDWYVNFERPYRRTPIGIDTFDLLLDLVIEPDLSGWSWKDEDEYEQGRRLGLIDDAMHARIEQTRQQVLALIERRDGPFAGAWSSRAPDPSWPLPVLPLEVLTIPTR